MRKNALAALKNAEQLKGQPVYVLDVFHAQVHEGPKMKDFYLFTALQDLYRNDELLADRAMERFSFNPEVQSTEKNVTEYELFSDRFTRMFPAYSLDERLRVRPGNETPRVNFKWLRELLLSQDLSRDGELEWIRDGKELRFLDGEDMLGN